VDRPFNPISGIVVLKGNLCENGAVLKPACATTEMMQHTGKAVVFKNIEDYKERIDDPDLQVDASSVLVLQNVGPKGYPGMPEVGNMGIPKKLLMEGVTDMVRISDGRMSGTAFGTIILHISPESADGGTLGLIEDGDIITLDVTNRSLNVHLDEVTLQKRKEAWKPLQFDASRGYVKLYVEHVQQAHLGADFDFLRGGSGSEVVRDSH